jgi:ribonuclease Z
MVFSEAATLAKLGNVKELWLTHFSPALTEPIDFLDQAKAIFSNSKVGADRMVKVFNFDNEE